MSIDESRRMSENFHVGRRKTKGTWGGWRPNAGRKAVLANPVRFTVDIEGHDFAALEALAEECGISRGAAVREAIRAYVTRRRKGVVHGREG
jgi:hypothetical protein